jgi:hypothetical protein
MENIVFSLEERKDIKDFIFVEEDLNTFYSATASTSTNGADTGIESVAVLEHYYKENYNVKSLQQILQYYSIPKKNMTKDEMIQRLLFFEMENENREMTIKRMRLWQNIRELKADAYFAKFINFNV